MLDNIGWGEILIILVVALIIIGPERLPGVIKDIRAAIFAARRAIANARAELDGEFGAEFDEIRQPLSQAAEWGRMGPRRAITKALLDEDDSFLEDFDPKKIMSETGVDPSRETPAQAARRLREEADALEAQGKRATNRSQPRKPPPRPEKTEKGNYQTGGGFSWEDIT